MRVMVNGKNEEMADGATVATLVEHLGLGRQRVAVEVNAELVTKAAWTARALKDGDRVEIVSFVGGG